MIRVFPRRTKWTPTDDKSFVGDPPLIRPIDNMVMVSVLFTWDILEGKRLVKAWSQYYDNVIIGGPAFGSVAEEFIPGQFIKDGVTITSRGCIRNCPWCFVPSREGIIKEISIKNGYIIQDNNLLACSRSHIENVFVMLRSQKEGIQFKGGLDSRLLKQWHVDLFNTIKVSEFWFACDEYRSLDHLYRVADLMADYPSKKKRCFVMIGYDSEPIGAAS